MRLVVRAAVSVAVAAPLAVAPGAVAQAAVPADVSVKAGPSGVYAKSAYLYDLTGSKTKWSRSATTKRPIGSITKMMTAYVVLRSGGLDRVLTVKKKHVDYLNGKGASTAMLQVGDKLTVRQLLNALMLPSGCDAAYVLADAYGPGWKGFVAKMNKTARDLKMTRTKYANFDGLNWPTDTSTYSTAYDQTRLALFAMKNKEFRTIVARKSYSLSPTATRHRYTWKSTNDLLTKNQYRGINGVKTGYTNAAGASFVFSATRNKRTLVGVVLNSGKDKNRRFTDATRILNWGFGVRSRDLLVLPRSTDTSFD